MRKFLLTAAVLTLYICAQGQEFIPIAVAVPKQADPLDEAQITRLGNITLDLATRSGMSATGSGSSIIMTPSFTIEKEDAVEGGMKNLVALSVDISFTVKNLESNVVYASINRQVRGAGASRQRAINDAISKIQLQGDDFDTFISTARDKIVEYYNNSCTALMTQAEAYAKTQQYDAAFALIASIPQTAKCFPKAMSIMEKYYPAYQSLSCTDLLQKARTFYGTHQYVDAMAVLFDLKVFPTDCKKEVNALIKDVEGKMSAEEHHAWDLVEQQMADKAFLTQKRLETIQAIAIAYYGRRPSNNLYNFIIR